MNVSSGHQSKRTYAFTRPRILVIDLPSGYHEAKLIVLGVVQDKSSILTGGDGSNRVPCELLLRIGFSTRDGDDERFEFRERVLDYSFEWPVVGMVVPVLVRVNRVSYLGRPAIDLLTMVDGDGVVCRAVGTDTNHETTSPIRASKRAGE